MRNEYSAIRRNILRDLPPRPALTRGQLQEQYGQVWSEEELKTEFVLLGQMNLFVGVMRRADGCKGSVQIEKESELYHSWTPQNS